MEDNSGVDSPPAEKPPAPWDVSGVLWWTALVVAACAVPSFGFAISYLFPFRGFLQLVVFILSCWLCTYLGMRLLENPRMAEKIGSKKEKP